VAGSFDSVRHDVLLAKVARRVQDVEILHVLKLILKASGKRGVPQGGVMTPPTQSQTLPGTGSCPIRGSCIRNIDKSDIDDSTLMTHARSAARASGPVCRTGESRARPLTAVSTARGAADLGSPVSRLAAPGPTVCGRGPAASRGSPRARGDGGVYGKAAGQSGAAAPEPGADHRRESQLACDARARSLAASHAARTRWWGIGASSTTTCLTAWVVSG
jgi:hypothetical protein